MITLSSLADLVYKNFIDFGYLSDNNNAENF